MGRSLRADGSTQGRSPAGRAGLAHRVRRDGVGVVVRRFDVYLINLDPTVGSEIRKVRPCVVVSPDEMNHNVRTVLVAPMTTKGQAYPTRVACRFAGKHGQVALDQLRAVDRARLVKRLGNLQPATQQQILATLAELFAP